MSTNTGGPAFPVVTSANIHNDGMTLRDYFAAEAMHAALITGKPVKGQTYDDLIEEAAFLAYKVADAMLKAREQ